MSYILSILEALKPYIVKGIVSAMPFVIDEIKKIIEKKEYNKMAKFLVTVKDKATNKAIEGATVNITIDGSGTIPYTTNADGQAIIGGLVVGASYPVAVSISGYDNFSESVVPVDEDTALSVDIALTATAVAAEIGTVISTASIVVDAVEKAATAASTSTTTTVSEDWDSIKAAAKAALASFQVTVNTDSVSTADLTNATTLVQEKVLQPVEDWLNLMITKRNKVANNWIKALGYDLNMAPAYGFKLYVAKEIASGISTLKSKVAETLSKI